jgi:hypothetical protein
MKKPKTCIFCGEQGSISKEHFWPEWVAPHIRAGEAGSNVSEFHAAEGKNAPSLQRRSERPGDVVTKKIRAVCERCNNGWMSEVESNVKPTILAGRQQNKSDKRRSLNAVLLDGRQDNRWRACLPRRLAHAKCRQISCLQRQNGPQLLPYLSRHPHRCLPSGLCTAFDDHLAEHDQPRSSFAQRRSAKHSGCLPPCR